MSRNDEAVPEPDRTATQDRPVVGRRTVLKSMIGTGIGLALASKGLNLAFADDATAPNAMPPQKGDYFVFIDGSKKGQLVTSADLTVGGPQVRVWPTQVSGDPASPTVSVVRDGNVQNMVLLSRFEVDQYKPDTKPYVTADGVVGYAATCTHQCCVVSDWNADQHLFHCPCHGSEYDPLNHAQQTPESPAPRPLPQLPLVLNAEGGEYPTVAAGFRTAVGCSPTGQ